MNIASLIKKAEKKPPRIMVYSTPGWGKSTLAASMPSPVFLDIEDGLFGLGVDTFGVESSYESVIEHMRALLQQEHSYKTVVIDTTSELERLIFAQVCKDGSKNAIEDFGYGKGYVHALDLWDRVLKGLDLLRDKGMAVVLVAHGEIKTISSPSFESYDRWVIRLHKAASARLAEWADCVFFGDHRVTVLASSDGKRSRGIGAGQRVLYTEERPAFLAKSRLDLPFEIDVPKDNGWEAVALCLGK